MCVCVCVRVRVRMCTYTYLYTFLLYGMLYVIFNVCVHFKNLVPVLSRLWYWICKVKE